MSINDRIASYLELEAVPYLTREALEAALADKIAYLMHYQTEELFSKLYRLDILEEKIKQVISEGGEIAQKIAGLVIDRQLEKELAKKQNPSAKPEDDSLAW